MTFLDWMPYLTGRRFLRVAAFVIFALTAVATSWADPNLALVRRTVLKKAEGRVDQVIPLPSGGFLVRDADLLNEHTQALEVYDASGRFVRKIGGFGPRPGSYMALKSIAVSGGTIWVADLIGRLSFFDLQGKLLGTKLLQRPGFQVEGIALDEARGHAYLSGCLPTHVYLDQGCKVVHQYNLKSTQYLGSFLDNDPQIRERNTIAFSDNSLDVDPQGVVWTVDAPVFKLFRLDPRSAKTQGFPIRSTTARPIAKVEAGSDTHAIYDNSYLVERVLVAGGHTVVSIRAPKGGSGLLAVFDAQGRQVATDLKPPGKLVGKTREGRLLFATGLKGGFEIGEYSLSLKASRPQAGR
jgi:hypothetical protein